MEWGSGLLQRLRRAAEREGGLTEVIGQQVALGDGDANRDFVVPGEGARSVERLEGLNGFQPAPTLERRARACKRGLDSRRGHPGSIQNGRSYTSRVPQEFEAHGVSDAGPRPTNEDACLVDAAGGLFVVADGMGGHNAGEVASALAVSTIASAIGASPVREASTLEDAVRRANGRILEAAAENADYAGMGTTVSAVLVEDGHAALVNVGDSRVYLLRDGRLEQLTRDDSWVRQLVDDGAPLSADDVQRHPMRHVLTEVVGVRPDLLPRVAVHELKTGDVLLISSDGLHGVLSADDLQAGLQTQAAAGAIAEQSGTAGRRRWDHRQRYGARRASASMTGASADGSAVRQPHVDRAAARPIQRLEVAERLRGLEDAERKPLTGNGQVVAAIGGNHHEHAGIGSALVQLPRGVQIPWTEPGGGRHACCVRQRRARLVESRCPGRIVRRNVGQKGEIVTWANGVEQGSRVGCCRLPSQRR